MDVYFTYFTLQGNSFSASNDARLFIFWCALDARHAKIWRPRMIFGLNMYPDCSDSEFL